MSDYTPTTDEVRDTYQWGVHACGCCAERKEEDLEVFDAWLAAHERGVAAKALRVLSAALVERYPADVFPKPTPLNYDLLNKALARANVTLDRFSADLMRRAAAQMSAEADRIERGEGDE